MIQAPERSMINDQSINNSKSYEPISVKFNIQNGHRGSLIPYKFQSNRYINGHFRYVRTISGTNFNR